MKRTIFVMLFCVAALTTLNSLAVAEEVSTENRTPSKTEQKIVFVRGDMSFLMQGDSETLKGESNCVLPNLLGQGWRIVSMHIVTPESGHSAGYILLEKS